MFRLSAVMLLVAAVCARADGPADNLPDKVRPIPPLGINLPDADREELEKGSDELGRDIEELRLKKSARVDLLPDVQIYHNALRYALKHNEFYQPGEVESARRLLRQGKERLAQLDRGMAPWTTARGLVVRGYVSRIDGSVQPYGLVVPDSYRPDAPYRHRLDVWLHGRGEKLTELNFLT